MLMEVHADAAAGEGYALVLQAQALLEPRFACEQDAAAGAHDAMPRQPPGNVKSPHHLPRRAGMAGGTRHLAIGRHLAARDLPDRLANAFEHCLTE